MRLRLPLLSLLSIVASSCAISDEPAFSDDAGADLVGGEEAEGAEGEGEGEAPSNDLCAGQEAVDPEPVVVSCGEDTGELVYRFESLSITEPAELGSILGGLIQKDIQDAKLHILLEARGLLSGDGAAFSIVGGGGAACEGQEGAYGWNTVTKNAQPSEAFPAELDEAGAFAVGDDASVLYFPVLLLNDSVRLDRLRVEGTLSEDRATLTGGKLTGYIYRSTADTLCLPPPFNTPLTSALPEARIEDCGGEDCWKLAGDFEARQVPLHALAE